MAGKGKSQKKDRRGGGAEGVMGNPAHERTDEMARMIEEMAGVGTRQSDMAVILQISEDTIQRHYKVEFQRGKAKAGVTLNKSLFQQALGTPKPDDPEKPEDGAADPLNPKNGFEKEPNLGAAIWLRKSQFGDKETSRHEVASGDINLTINEPGDADL